MCTHGITRAWDVGVHMVSLELGRGSMRGAHMLSMEPEEGSVKGVHMVSLEPEGEFVKCEHNFLVIYVPMSL